MFRFVCMIGLLWAASVAHGEDLEKLFLSVDVPVSEFMGVPDKSDEVQFVSMDEPQFDAVPTQKPRQHVPPPPLHQEVQKPAQAPMQKGFYQSDSYYAFGERRLFRGRGGAPVRRVIGAVFGRRGC